MPQYSALQHAFQINFTILDLIYLNVLVLALFHCHACIINPAKRHKFFVLHQGMLSALLKIYIRAKLWGFVPELLQQFSVAGIWQQLTGPRVTLQLLIQVGHGEGVHHWFLWWNKQNNIFVSVISVVTNKHSGGPPIMHCSRIKFISAFSSLTWTTCALSRWITTLKTQVGCLLSFSKLEHSQCEFTLVILSASMSKSSPLV